MPYDDFEVLLALPLANRGAVQCRSMPSASDGDGIGGATITSVRFTFYGAPRAFAVV